MKRSILGITMGDPAGIGPEITVKALNRPELYEKCKPVVIGDTEILERACKFTGNTKIRIRSISSIEEALFEYGTIDVLDMHLIGIDDYEIGKVSAKAGNAAFQYVKKVIELAMKKEVDATVTNPLNKEAMNLAGHHFSGHTEIYAEIERSKDETRI